MTSPSRARLTIDLDALASNRAVLEAQAWGAEVAAVVKADGYGLGAGPISRRLWAEGTRSFFVARISEGEALRTELQDRQATIYVLDGLLPDTADRLRASRLTPVISTWRQLEAARDVKSMVVALQVDTGMNRQGLTPSEALEVAHAPGGLKIGLLMSHLGSATDPHEPRNEQQLAVFRGVRAGFPQIPASFAASAGAFLGPAYRYDMIRAGISLYGGGPEERPDARLKAVATLTAPILDIRRIGLGDRVGYGANFTADKPMRIAVVAAGYADGVIRAGMGRGRAWVAGALRPVLAINMDLTVIDLGQSGPPMGSQVELLGPNVLLDDVAEAAGTVAHELLVRLGTRAERVYLGEV